MLARQTLDPILDEALTRGLGDPEARVLVEWLVDQAEGLTGAGSAEDDTPDQIDRLCRRGRAISRFVHLWCYRGARRAALQLAGTERFHWPLPVGPADPCELMQSILQWETRAKCRV